MSLTLITLITLISIGVGTGWLLRLTKPWHGTCRRIGGDSAFGSVEAAVALFSVGLYASLNVKTATSMFPSAVLHQNPLYPSRGSHLVYSATIQGVAMYAVGWKDKNIKAFVATYGTTLPGTPHTKHRSRWINAEETEKFSYDVPRPAIVETYFSFSQQVDVHNHSRQSGLALETAWRTQDWECRVASTFEGICETDAYYMFRYDHPEHKRWTTHREFTAVLVEALVNSEGEEPSCKGGNALYMYMRLMCYVM